MDKRTLAFLCGLAMLLSACVVTSLHPFYTSKDVAFEPVLLGQWTNSQQAEEKWTFQQDGQNAYHLTYVTGDSTNLTKAHLFKLGGQTFIDVAGLDQNWNTVPPPIPSHLLLRVLQLSPTLRMAPLSNEWLKTFLEKKPEVLRHQFIGENGKEARVVLMDETKALQQFIVRHLKTDEAWQDSLELQRAGPIQSAKGTEPAK